MKVHNAHNYKVIEKLKEQYSSLKNTIIIKNKQKCSNIQFFVDKLCNLMNTIAIYHIKQNQCHIAQDWLTRALYYSKNSILMKITILNNIVCMYKKQEKYQLCLENLKIIGQLLQKITKNQESTELTVDYLLNFSSVLSALNNHQEAISKIRSAMNMLKICSNNKKIEQIKFVAQYNEAVELQHLKQFKQSLKNYKTCLNYLSLSNKQHYLKQSIHKAIRELQKKCDEQYYSFKSISSVKNAKNANKNYFQRIDPKEQLFCCIKKCQMSPNFFSSVKQTPKKLKQNNNPLHHLAIINKFSRNGHTRRRSLLVTSNKQNQIKI